MQTHLSLFITYQYHRLPDFLRYNSNMVRLNIPDVFVCYHFSNPDINALLNHNIFYLNQWLDKIFQA